MHTNASMIALWTFVLGLRKLPTNKGHYNLGRPDSLRSTQNQKNASDLVTLASIDRQNGSGWAGSLSLSPAMPSSILCRQ